MAPETQATSAGLINQVATFAAYGQLIAVHAANSAVAGTSESAFKSNLGYSGEQWDASLRMQNLRARAYDPASGRFIGLDPFAGNMQDPQSLHKYAYVHGDPIQGIDPTGMYLGGTISVTIIGASLGILGNGLGNISNNRSFFENAGSAALWGAGLGVFGVLVPAAGVLLAGVGIGLAISNFTSVWNSDPAPTPSQLWAASALVLLSAIGGFGAAKYGAKTSANGLFWFNPGGFNFSVASAFREQLAMAMDTAKSLNKIPVWSEVTTGIALVMKSNGEIVKVAMGNGRDGNIVPSHRQALPADVLTPRIRNSDVPSKFRNPQTNRVHAEGYLFAWAESMGYRVLSVGANRGICPSCAKMTTENGAGHMSPLRDKGPELAPLELFYDWFGFTGYDAAAGAAGGADLQD